MNNISQTLYDTTFADYPEILDVEQVSCILNVSKIAVYNIIKRGALSCLRIGRSIRVPRYFLMLYLNIVDKENPES